MIRTHRAPAWHPADEFKPAQFLTVLNAVCELMLGGWQPGGMQKLRDIYRILALLPQTGRNYSLQGFAYDVYLLDRHHLEAAAKSGLAFYLDRGSTAARKRSNLLVVTSSEGLELDYYGIEFLHAAAPAES